MSDLLNSASLVMIPSGYKEDVVYSQIPTDGSGDLSFTRASNGTRINSAGLVEVTPWNLAEQSESFDNVAWVKTTDGQVTITANATTAPNGTLTADKMIASANAGFHCVAQTQSLVAGVFTISIYAKASEYSFLQIFDSLTTDFANFNLTTGAVATVDTYTATIENVGNGWYRCTATKTNPSGNFTFRYGIVTTGTATRGESFTGNGVNGLFIWGAQLNIGSLKPYFPTTDRLNVPRLTYQNGGGGCPSLLLEKQSTNLVTYSEQFDNVDWTSVSATVSANSTTSPDGTQNADLIYPSSSGSNLGLYQNTAGVTGVVGTVSCYVKSAGKNWALLGTDNQSSYNVSFDLVNGVVGSVPTGHSATITSVGNGWYKITVTYQSGYSFPYPFIGVADNTNRSVTADGTNGIYIWGFQIEISSYPTSYIPTTSSTATRVADACSKTGISSLIGQTEGTIFLQTKYLKTGTTTSGRWFKVYGASNEIALAIHGQNYVRSIINSASDSITTGPLSTTGIKIAWAYNASGVVLFINGVEYALPNGGSQIMSSLNSIAFDPSANTSFLEGTISQTALFKTRLTNAELASLTTI